MTITRVKLELLRLGPPHNQLLSPLTRYLAVCGNQPVEEVKVEWEHRDFLRKLAPLRYKPGLESLRIDEVHSLGRDMGKMLGRIDGLKKRLVEAHANDDEALTQLEVVLSASELAMLPFELTRSFAGAPGSEEQFLLVQPSAQIEITRRVRGVFERHIEWPREPKLLFIAAQPEGMQVPMQAHLQALLEAMRPFIRYHEDSPQGLLEATRPYLHVLPRASVAEIEQLCREIQFSYVHVLAHGLEDDKLPGSPYGLALHAGPGRDEKEIVTGDRLTAALGIADRRPSVVTLASCDSGNVKEVIHNGASLAHELHRAGIPLVIGSQFPLSFEASIDMVSQVYRQLPRGVDPRRIIHRLRRRLYACYAARTHDWASLIVYATLPEDLSEQLEEVEYRSARLALDATMNRFDHELEHLTADQQEVEEDMLEPLQARVDETFERLPKQGRWALDAEALRAVATKRVAQSYFKVGKLQPEDRSKLWQRSLVQLDASRRHYATATRRTTVSTNDAVVQPPLHWLATQQICLDAVFGRPFDRDLLALARVTGKLDAAHGAPDVQLGALSGLVELDLLVLADANASEGQRDDARHAAMEWLERMVEEGNDTREFVLYSTYMQLRRYVEWFWDAELIAFQRERKIERKMVGEAGSTSPIVELATTMITYMETHCDDPRIIA